MLVPHRDEFSETIAYEIQGPTKRALFVPDIDSWDQWQEEYGENIADRLAAVDFAFLDATFYDDHELPGRDMSQIPHPRVLDSMRRLADLTGADRAEVYFIHINHSNPIRDPESEQTKRVRKSGFNVARRGQQFCL